MSVALTKITVKSGRSEGGCCRDALLVQDACNLSGVAHSFSEVLSDLRRNGVQDLAKHPATVLFIDKLCDLAQLPHLGAMDAFSKAWDYCQQKASEEQ